MEPITIRYTFSPKKRSLATGHVADLFGLADDEPPHTVTDGVVLDVRPGDLVLFTGPSGSGKSSLLRAAGRQLGALDAASLVLPDHPLIDCLAGPVETRLEKLAACGLSEARLLLRSPDELSDGQRYRFRLAYALEQLDALGGRHRHQTVATAAGHRYQTVGTVEAGFLMADEFAANLDRTLAKVLAYNVRKLCSRTGAGFLLATTHDDLLADLNPDVWVRCLGDGAVECARRDVKKKGHQLRPRALAVGRHPCRLAVLRSVALPEPPPRLHAPPRPTLARRRANRRLRLQHARRIPEPADALLRPAQPALGGGAVGAEPAVVAPVACGAAPDVPRRGHRGGVRAAGVPDVSGGLDRDADGDGASEPVL